jgi:diacylglycerol kinase family enzyme
MAIGGDGTLNEVLSGLVRLDEPSDRLPELGFLPSGTANAAILAFVFSASPEAVARALPGTEARPVDVGVVTHAGTQRPFLLWFGPGYDAVVIDALNRERTGHMGIAGLARGVPRILRAVHRYPAPTIRVMSEGSPPASAASVVLATVGRTAFGGTVAAAADPHDGHLDLVTIERRGTLGVAGVAMRMMATSLAEARGAAHWTATRVRFESDGEVPFQLDGEPVGTLPAEVRVAPAAVRLLLT